MSSTSLQLLPFCTHCSTVKAEGNWFLNNGSSAKTTAKLDPCSRCHIARYCNQTCQKADWKKHRTICKQQEKVISGIEVDRLVQDLPQSGKVVLTLDQSKNPSSVQNVSSKEHSRLSVDVKIEESPIGTFSYLACSDFNWAEKLDLILNPPNGIHNPGAQVELGVEMVEKGMYIAAFQMMNERAPKHYGFLKDMFFLRAIKTMDTKGVSMEEMAACASIIGKNREEVRVLITPLKKIELPEELQTKIDAAKELSYGARDVQMLPLANEVVDLGHYDLAFQLIYDWVVENSVKTLFFRHAAEQMVSNEISYVEPPSPKGEGFLFHHSLLEGSSTGLFPRRSDGS